MAKWAERYWRLIDRHPAAGHRAVDSVRRVWPHSVSRIQINHNPTDSLGETSPVAQQIALVGSTSSLPDWSHFVGYRVRYPGYLSARNATSMNWSRCKFHPGRWMHPLSATSFADYLALLNGGASRERKCRRPKIERQIAELIASADHDRVSERMPTRTTVRSASRYGHNIDDRCAAQDAWGRSGLLSTKTSTPA